MYRLQCHTSLNRQEEPSDCSLTSQSLWRNPPQITHQYESSVTYRYAPQWNLHVSYSSYVWYTFSDNIYLEEIL